MYSIPPSKFTPYLVPDDTVEYFLNQVAIKSNAFYRNCLQNHVGELILGIAQTLAKFYVSCGNSKIISFQRKKNNFILMGKCVVKSEKYEMMHISK